MITQASYCPGPGAVCCRRAIAACESVQMCTFVYGRAASWGALPLVVCLSFEATSNASATA